jgi:hypothetical protein
MYKMNKTQQLHHCESPVSFCVLYKDGSSGQVDLKELVRQVPFLNYGNTTMNLFCSKLCISLHLLLISCRHCWYYVNPFLFIRGLSFPRSGFPYNLFPVSCCDIGFLKKHRSSIGLEFGPQSAFTTFRAFLPSANYYAEWSGRVWHPAADSNGSLALFLLIWSSPNSHYSLQRATTPDPASSNFKKSILSAKGCPSVL